MITDYRTGCVEASGSALAAGSEGDRSAERRGPPERNVDACRFTVSRDVRLPSDAYYPPLNDSSGVSFRTMRVRRPCTRMTLVMSLYALGASSTNRGANR